MIKSGQLLSLNGPISNALTLGIICSLHIPTVRNNNNTYRARALLIRHLSLIIIHILSFYITQKI